MNERFRGNSNPTQTAPNSIAEEYVAAITKVMPSNIMQEARDIVAAHRPEGIPEGAEPVCMAGITREEHGDLNIPSEVYPGGREAKVRRMEQLRRQYRDDPIALQQIDRYDINSPYGRMLKKYREALHSGDEQKQAELDAWFQKNYPDVD